MDLLQEYFNFLQDLNLKNNYYNKNKFAHEKIKAFIVYQGLYNIDIEKTRKEIIKNLRRA